MDSRFRPQVEWLDDRLAPAVFGTPWPTSNLTISFAPDGTDVNGAPSSAASAFAGTPADVWQLEVLHAFQTWAVAANVNIGLVADGGQPFGVSGAPQGDARFGDVRVAAVPLDAGAIALAMPFDVVAGTRSGDVWFNSSLLLGTGGGGTYDVFSTALHEAGHVFGVGPSTDPASAMFQQAVRHTGLSAADVNAITALYGARTSDAFDAVRRNETIATATRARFTSESNGNSATKLTAELTTAADVDVYSFRAENLRGGGLTARVRVSGYSLLVPRLEILDTTGRVVASGAGARPGAGDITLHLTNLKEGATYYARVSAGRMDVFGVGGYKLELRPDASPAPADETRLLAPDDRNDTLGRAMQIDDDYLATGPRFAYTLSAALNSATDVDFYRLKSPQTPGDAPVTMTASVWATSSGGTDPVIDVYDDRGRRVAAQVVVHDGGAFTVQVVGAIPNEDYYVAVRHARTGSGAVAGNYVLDVAFGGPAAQLADASSGRLSANAPVAVSALTVTQAQVLHLVLDLTGNAAGTTAGARLTILDQGGAVVASRFVASGDSASLNVYLRPGTYRVFVAGGTLDGSTFAGLSYTLRWLVLSDPIGPIPVGTITDPAGAPPPPSTTEPEPPTEWSTPGMYAPIESVSPLTEPWWVAAPADWYLYSELLTSQLAPVQP